MKRSLQTRHTPGNGSPVARLRGGFTLIEIMAASAIMLIVIGSVLTLANFVMKQFSQATNQLYTAVELRQSFDLLVSDLETAILRDDGGIWMEIVRENVGNADNVAKLYFFTTSSQRPRALANSSGIIDANRDGRADNPIEGSLGAVSYRIVYQNPFNPRRSDEPFARYGFYRAIIDPEITFKYFLPTEVPLLSQRWERFPRGEGLVDVDSRRSYKRPAEVYAREPFNLLAARVVDFSIEVLFNDLETGRAGSIDSRKAGRIVLPLTTDARGSLPVGTVLTGLRLSLTLIDAEGERILRYGNGDLSDYTFRQRHTETFVRTVPLVVAPL